MTNEKAPERIWAWHIRTQDGHWIGKNAVQDTKPNHPDAVEYIRHDHALALVAEAYGAAATRINKLSHTATATGNFTQASALANEAESILALIPADALAAREARDKRIREEAVIAQECDT